MEELIPYIVMPGMPILLLIAVGLSGHNNEKSEESE